MDGEVAGEGLSPGTPSWTQPHHGLVHFPNPIPKGVERFLKAEVREICEDEQGSHLKVCVSEEATESQRLSLSLYRFRILDSEESRQSGKVPQWRMKDGGRETERERKRENEYEYGAIDR